MSPSPLLAAWVQHQKGLLKRRRSRRADGAHINGLVECPTLVRRTLRREEMGVNALKRLILGIEVLHRCRDTPMAEGFHRVTLHRFEADVNHAGTISRNLAETVSDLAQHIACA